MEDAVIKYDITTNHTKYAIFDYDGTLVKPKENRKFPINVDDWQYTRNSVFDVIQKYKLDHHIIIVTDQTKLWKVDQIKLVLKDLQLETNTTVIIGGKTHKPDTSFFIKIFPNYNDLDIISYVGDAAGRQGDWSDCDKQFANNLNIKFMVPEEIFPLDIIQTTEISINENKEVIIMIGYPGSGKTTLCNKLCESSNNKYYIVSGDKLKTTSKMIKDATLHITTKSIIFDSTAGTKEKRSEFINFAKKYNLPVRAIWVQTSFDISMERNKQRSMITNIKIPDIVYYIYRKKFEEPTEDEGFILNKL